MNQYIFMVITRSVIFRKEMFHTNVIEKIKTHISCSATFFSESLAVYEIMQKNIVDPDKPQMTIRRMRIACWIPKSTYTHSRLCNFIVFPLQMWLKENTSMLRYTYISCLVYWWNVWKKIRPNLMLSVKCCNVLT
jgi:hypothetical protein